MTALTAWDAPIERARQLAIAGDASRDLLAFYAALLDAQRAVHEGLSSALARPAGDIQSDLPSLGPLVPPLLERIAGIGPATLARDATGLFHGGEAAWQPLLVEYWRTLSATGSDACAAPAFFAKACLQPYARWLVESGTPILRDRSREGVRCPACGGLPQVGVIRGTASEGAGRSLLCALCLSTWPFRRLVCPACGEEDERQLGVYHADPWAHVRLETCETCRRYLKTVDLARLGVADPLADEVAAAALDAWAHTRGYVKVELNLLGL